MHDTFSEFVHASYNIINIESLICTLLSMASVFLHDSSIGAHLYINYERYILNYLKAFDKRLGLGGGGGEF